MAKKKLMSHEKLLQETNMSQIDEIRPHLPAHPTAETQSPTDNPPISSPFSKPEMVNSNTLPKQDKTNNVIVPGVTPVQPTGPDPFDPAALRLTQDYASTGGVRKVLLSVPVRKPDKSWFVRVNPDEQYRIQTNVIELKEERETYLVARSLWPELATEPTFRPKLLATAINRQNVLFIWEVNLPKDDKVDDWTRTALEGINRATTTWVRIAANMPLGAYDLYEAQGELSEPEWPTTPFNELLRIAFKNRYIDDLDHPVLRRLRGES